MSVWKEFGKLKFRNKHNRLEDDMDYRTGLNKVDREDVKFK